MEIDLGFSATIESVKLYNRACRNNDAANCTCRLSHATLVLLNEEREWIHGLFLGDMCGVMEVVHDFESSLEFCLE